MTATFALVLTVLLVADQPDIQGTWIGTGREARYTLVFCGDILQARVGTDPILRARESRFRADAEKGTIDFDRDDGLQLGLYSIEGDTLTLMLADVNLARPESIDFPIIKPTRFPIVIDRKTWKPPTQQRIVFERAANAAE